jgi:hypothetical protein
MKYSGNVLALIVVALLISSICYEVYLCFRKDGKRLSLRTYLKLQKMKVGALYFLLGLIVFAHGGWRLGLLNLVESIFGVFVLSILFGYVDPFPDQDMP